MGNISEKDQKNTGFTKEFNFIDQSQFDKLRQNQILCNSSLLICRI
jgi:hypothetical protein